jgi:hypothetical protein
VKRIFMMAGIAAAVSLPAWRKMAQAAPPAKVRVCHMNPYTSDPRPRVIRIDKTALRTHLAHGDFETDAPVGSFCDTPI